MGARSSSASFFFPSSFFCLFVLIASASHTHANKQTKQQYKQNREERETTTSTKRPWSDHALLSLALPYPLLTYASFDQPPIVASPDNLLLSFMD